VYPAKKAPLPLGYLRHVPEEEFFRFLRALHHRTLLEKDKNILISPAVFDPERVEGTTRAKGNIVFLRHVWLDFESGDLKPTEFPELFPYLRMVVTNTYRHTAENPRFRVIIPTTQSMGPEAYEIVQVAIASKLEDAGYSVEGWKRTSRYAPSRKSGLDWGKRAPTSLFNAPCQAEDPSESFFEVHAGARVTLDPTLWIENSGYLIQTEAEFAEPRWERSRGVNKEAVQAAVEKWRVSSAFPGEGGMRFFNFALDLRSTGMSLHEIEAMLSSEAPYGRSPAERKAQITSIMNSLRRSSRK